MCENFFSYWELSLRLLGRACIQYMSPQNSFDVISVNLRPQLWCMNFRSQLSRSWLRNLEFKYGPTLIEI